MSLWKHYALKQLPRFRKFVEQADSPDLMWKGLAQAFFEAFEGDRIIEVQEIFAYGCCCKEHCGLEQYQSISYEAFMEFVLSEMLHSNKAAEFIAGHVEKEQFRKIAAGLKSCTDSETWKSFNTLIELHRKKNKH